MKLKAYAKINLSLRVFDKRPDGFHNIESIMQSVSLHDSITLLPIPSGVEVTCDDPKVPQGKENIAYKAAEFFLEREKGVGGVKIHIEKKIPMAAGLAGGSADAAAVLYGLNQMSNLACRQAGVKSQISNNELLNLAAEIGSDVPFCLTGGTCLVKGRGETIEKLEPWPKTYFILVCPEIQVSSKWAYEKFDEMHLTVSEEIKNDLEQVVISEYEIVSDIREKLLKLGCSEAQMSGSGPSVFGMVRHKMEAEEIYSEIMLEYPRGFLVETVDRGVEAEK